MLLFIVSLNSSAHNSHLKYLSQFLYIFVYLEIGLFRFLKAVSVLFMGLNRCCSESFFKPMPLHLVVSRKLQNR